MESTSWTLVRAAGHGDAVSRDAFVRLYGPAVRAGLAGLWRLAPSSEAIDDAFQEVFVECLREGGVLDRVADRRPRSFRAFLFGVVKNIARRHDRTRGRQRAGELSSTEFRAVPEAGCSDPALAFDRAWARQMVAEALRRVAVAEQGERRPISSRQLLDMRFGSDMPVRDIARAYDLDPQIVHRQYELARRRFRAALRDVVAEHEPACDGDVDAECRRIMEALR